MKYKIDQIAIYVGDRDEKMDKINGIFGTKDWVKDEVISEGDDGWNDFDFDYNLGFNYEILKGGLEFEIIQGVNGISYHNGLTPPCISHFGSHVDNLEEAVEYFENKGFPEIQRNKTIYHTGTDRKYEYAFVDTRSLFGYLLKLIKRLEG